MSVVERLTAELAAMPEDLACSTLAASALALAGELDDVVAEEECESCGHTQSWTVSHNSATSKSMVAKELRETLAELRELAPPKPQQEDEVDSARMRRADRLGRSAAGAASPS